MAAGTEFMLLKEIRKEAEQRAVTLGDHLSIGVPEDYAAYRELVGYLRAWREIVAFTEQQNEIFMRK